nr:Conjugal transfer ATP-binding protein, putative [Ipomoea batatas]
MPLCANHLTSGFCLGLEPIIVLDPFLDLLGAPGKLNVLNADMDPLPDDPIPNLWSHQNGKKHTIRTERIKQGKYLFVDFDANGALGDIPDTTGAAVVELVRHALVHGAVDLDVDIVSDVEDPEVGGQRDSSALPESTGEEIPRPRSYTVTGRHFVSFVSALRLLNSCRSRKERSRWRGMEPVIRAAADDHCGVEVGPFGVLAFALVGVLVATEGLRSWEVPATVLALKSPARSHRRRRSAQRRGRILSRRA